MSVFSVMALILPAARTSLAIESRQAQAFVGQDLHLVGEELISYQLSTGEHALVFRGGFSMSIGANQFASEDAVVWLESVRTESRGRTQIDYKIIAYLKGNVSAQKGQGARTTPILGTELEDGQAMIVQFEVSGEVFVTAQKREIADPRESELYKKAVSSCQAIGIKVKFIEKVKIPPEVPVEKKPLEKLPEKPKVEEIRFRYPINVAPIGRVSPQIEWDEQKGIGTIIGRFYLSQKQDEKGGLLELQADNAVIFYTRREQVGLEDVLARGAVSAIYLAGDVVMTQDQRIIRADEIYYNFEIKKALAINAEMKNFDVSRGVPIYVRASKLRQLAENKFEAENPTVTTSEFHLPQISFTASQASITDTTGIDQRQGRASDRSYDAQMSDVRLKMYDKTIFYWPFIRSNLQRPDVPLKSIHTSYDRTWGASVETRWYLSRLLGLREPEGTDSTFAMDYYSKRGVGTGFEIEYEREDYYGRLLGYLIHDMGDDDLGRYYARRNIEPPRDLRGRFSLRHRHFLPDNWQLTAEVGYLSDENFMEQFYRSEFNAGKKQETIVHLKNIQDNRGLSLLGKFHINDFADELEELPSVEFHWTGQSLFDDTFTLYSDTQISRFRQRIGDEHSTMIDQDFFSFVSHRAELDMPVWLSAFKVVPFVAGTFGYDDRSGFTRSLVDGRYTGEFGQDSVWIGEAGIRTAARPYWKIYPNVKSRLWDLNQLRHIIKPYLTAVAYEENDDVVEQRDVLNVGISQRLQTKRGASNGVSNLDDNIRTVDWMRLNLDFTWVNDSASASNSGADRFIWNKPFVPMRVLSVPSIYHGDLMASLRRFEVFGPRRNYFGADYLWQVSDSTALLSDLNYDMQSGVVQQFDIGFARMRWPNLSYYIGSRYLRRVQILDEKGSNAFTFAATYVLDPRYTVVFSQQYDFDYAANIRSDITLIRRYHRLFYALTYSADESLKRHAIVFSIWPQGVPEMALGPRRYMKLGGPADY